MQKFEYRVVPAPKQGLKAKGVRSHEERFAHALEVMMNDMGAQGWDYVRADVLPAEERQGLTGRVTVYQNMLVFRRVVEEVEAVTMLQLPDYAPFVPVAPVVTPVVAAPQVRLMDTDTTVVAAPLVGVRLVGE